jgi:hypothetical protein
MVIQENSSGSREGAIVQRHALPLYQRGHPFTFTAALHRGHAAPWHARHHVLPQLGQGA